MVVVKFLFMVNVKVYGVGDFSGFVKLVVDVKYGELLGGYLVGYDVVELLLEFMLV